MSKEKGLLKKVFMHTLQQRMILLLGVSMLLCFLLVVVVSYITLKAAEINRIENTLEMDLRQLTDRMDEEYYSLVQISQQMIASGNVGSSVNTYFSSETPYDRFDASKNVTSNMNIMIFSHDKISLVGYYLLKEDGVISGTLFNTFPVRSTVDPREMISLAQTQEVDFKAVHKSLNLFSNRDTISLVRQANFNGNVECLIYAELFTNVGQDLQTLVEARDLPYSFLHTDEQGRICYSSSERFSVGDTAFSDSDGIQELQGYSYLRIRSKLGFYNVLLLPRDAYNQQLLYWKMGIGSVLLASVALVALTGVLLYKLIYRPLQILGRDMAEAGKGNLIPVSRFFNIDEFDLLFSQFEDMKTQIVKLMKDMRVQEAERNRLELDKLYYQINPHFLMNALNSVHWMAVAQDQPEIDRFVYQLNYILSYSLGKTDRRATLRTELKSLELYLALQQERYNFEVWMDVETGDYLDYPSARLILQPLAENAVCHNLSDFGNLWVTIRREEPDRILIIMRDDGHGLPVAAEDGVTPSSQLNKGIGLRYVQMSLQSFYGKDAELTIESVGQRGTTVTLRLPVRKGDVPDVPDPDR